jgi:hypothetical protein
MYKEKYLAVIVAFNRPQHLKRCLECLKIANDNFKLNIDFKIVIDKDEKRRDNWIKTVDLSKKSGFNFEINKKNKGLRNNILDIIKEFQNSNYHRLIVIEDDILVKNDFFRLFKKMFDNYETRNDVFQISGFSPLNRDTDDIEFYPRLSTWGWGVWKNKLPIQEDILIDYRNFKLTSEEEIYYKKYYPDVLKLHRLQKKRKINSWSLDYLHYMTKNKLVTAYPTKSNIKNIGFDGSGVNMRNSKPFLNLNNLLFLINKTSTVSHRISTRQIFTRYYNNSFISKVKRKLGILK